MTRSIHSQRGEGKIGCVVTLLVLSVAVAAAFKVVPPYYNNNELKAAAKDIASRASVIPIASIEAQIKAKAKEMQLEEALAPGAITVQKTGDTNKGNCIVTLRYSQTIDFYGFTSYTMETDEKLSVPYMNANY